MGGDLSTPLLAVSPHCNEQKVLRGKKWQRNKQVSG
jgi:hypothetical protein